MIIWLTGQPGSGKTTLANAFMERVKQDNPDIISFDTCSNSALKCISGH